jgi:peptide/nickel transport system permease protein
VNSTAGYPGLRAYAPRASRGLWRDALRRLLRNRSGLLGLAAIGVLLLAAITAPIIAPYRPDVGQLRDSLLTPGPGHLMGTDIQGRDVFSRVVFGARLSLQVGVISVAIGLLLGGIIGGLAGAIGGFVDSALMRVVDVLLAFPAILLAIGIVSWLGRGLPQIMVAIAVVNVPYFARLLRASLLALRESDFVIAARSLGADGPRLLLHHMLPNALTPLIVQATLALATAIVDVAGLGFLGLGPPDPRTPEWGSMLTDSTLYLRTAPYLIFFPGAAIAISAIGFNLLGDALRESIDPRLKR